MNARATLQTKESRLESQSTSRGFHRTADYEKKKQRDSRSRNVRWKRGKLPSNRGRIRVDQVPFTTRASFPQASREIRSSDRHPLVARAFFFCVYNGPVLHVPKTSARVCESLEFLNSSSSVSRDDEDASRDFLSPRGCRKFTLQFYTKLLNFSPNLKSAGHNIHTYAVV